MITPQEEAYVSERAYVPEHIINLMGPISKGEPFLNEEHLGFVKDNWLILVGYPLDGNLSQARSERVLKQAVEAFRPEVLWFIGPEILPSFFRRGNLLVSVSTSGVSPALARRIRTKLEENLGEEYSSILSLIGEVRSTLMRKGYTVDAGTWQEALDLDPLMRLVKAGRWKQAIAFLLSRLTVDEQE
jgi:hypothetical protein